MIDFKKRDLYARDKKNFDNFKNNILVKESERNAGVSYEDEDLGFNRLETKDIVDSEFDFGDDSFGGFGDFGDGGFGFDDPFGSGSEDREDGITQRGDLSNNQEHLMFSNKIISWILSPVFLFYYVILHTTRNNLKLNDWQNELEMLKRVNVIMMFTALLFFLLGGRTIISPWFQLITGIVLFVFSTIMLKRIEGGEEAQVEEEEGDGFGSGLDFDNDIFGGDSAGFSDDLDLLDTKEPTFADTVLDFDDGENDFFEEAPDGVEEQGLPKSPLTVTDDDAFERDIATVFKMGEKNIGIGSQSRSREEILNSFGVYLATNFTKFGEWKIVNETSISYLNVGFTLFLALNKINNKFGRATIDPETGVKEYDKLVITDIKENTMMYRIEIELPEYFKLKTLTSNKEEFHNVLKASENDDEVDFLIATYRQGFVIKLFKPAKQMISLGDILRYNDPNSDAKTPLEQFLDPKKGLPVLLGLKNNEYPVVIDYEDNTSGVIVGGSGSGKSWFTFMMLENFLISNDYHNLQMMIFDKKAAPFWKTYALTPHVIGYHTQTEKLLEICQEVYAEIGRRKELLNELGAESMQGLRAKYRKQGKTEELKRVPLLLFIVDEITSTMVELEEMDEKGALYKEVKGIMGKITQEGRSLGVRMIAIGQRSIDKSIPKNVMANSSFKFGMKLDAESDFLQLGMDNDIKTLGAPKGKGLGILKAMEEETSSIKTVTVGGTSEPQIIILIRAIALEWNRRSIGDEFVTETTNTFKVGYNRDKFRESAMSILERGEIIPTVRDSNLALDMATVNKRIKTNKVNEDEDVNIVSNTAQEDKNSNSLGIGGFSLGDSDEDFDTDMFSMEIKTKPNTYQEDDNQGYDFGDDFGDDNDFKEVAEESYQGLDDLGSNEEDYTFSEEPESEDEYTFNEEPESEDEYTFNEEPEPEYSFNEEPKEEETELENSEEDDMGDFDFDDMDLDDLESEEFGEENEESEEEESTELPKLSQEDIEVVKVKESPKPKEEDSYGLDDYSMFDIKELGSEYLESYGDIELEELHKTIDTIDEDVKKSVEDDERLLKVKGIDTSDDIYNIVDFDDFDDFEELGDKKEPEVVQPKPKTTVKPKVEKEIEMEDAITGVKPKVVSKQQTNKYKKPVSSAGKKASRKPIVREEVKPTSKPKVEQPKTKVETKVNSEIDTSKRIQPKTKPKQQTQEPTGGIKKPSNGLVFTPPKMESNADLGRRKRNPAEVAKLKMYIINNGAPRLGKYSVPKAELREHFDGHTIGDALDDSVILSQGDNFITLL